MIAWVNAAYKPWRPSPPVLRKWAPRVRSPVALAGADRVVWDAVGVAVLRSFGMTSAVASGPIFQQEQIARAVELGLEFAARPASCCSLTIRPVRRVRSCC